MAKDKTSAIIEAGKAPRSGLAAVFEPRNFDEAERMSKMLAASDFVPKDMKNNPGNVLVAMQYGAEIGLKPLQACQNIAVINGRPCLYGDAMLAVVMGSGLVEDMKESFEPGKSEEDYAAVCRVKRKEIAEPIVARFSVKDAKRASLWGKAGPWTQYPQRMLQMRARGFALRNGFPDILKGVIAREEAEDIREVESVVVPDKPVALRDVMNGTARPAEASVPEPSPQPAPLVQDEERLAIQSEMTDAEKAAVIEKEKREAAPAKPAKKTTLFEE
jgi:hypothetical protein